MNPYVTSDTGEALALRACGLPFAQDPYSTSNGAGGMKWTFVFEDSRQRELVSRFYFDAYETPNLGKTVLTDEEIALVVNVTLRLRKEIFGKSR